MFLVDCLCQKIRDGEEFCSDRGVASPMAQGRLETWDWNSFGDVVVAWRLFGCRQCEMARLISCGTLSLHRRTTIFPESKLFPPHLLTRNVPHFGARFHSRCLYLCIFVRYHCWIRLRGRKRGAVPDVSEYLHQSHHVLPATEQGWNALSISSKWPCPSVHPILFHIHEFSTVIHRVNIVNTYR